MAYKVIVEITLVKWYGKYYAQATVGGKVLKKKEIPEIRYYELLNKGSDE